MNHLHYFNRVTVYTGQKSNISSAILKLASYTFKDLFGKEPYIKAVSTGIQYRVIGEECPGIDMVSMEPNSKPPVPLTKEREGDN